MMTSYDGNADYLRALAASLDQDRVAAATPAVAARGCTECRSEPVSPLVYVLEVGAETDRGPLCEQCLAELDTSADSPLDPR